MEKSLEQLKQEYEKTTVLLEREKPLSLSSTDNFDLLSNGIGN